MAKTATAVVKSESHGELINQFKQNQMDRFAKSLERRVKRFEEKLGDPKQQEIMVLRIKSQDLRNRIDELRGNRKAINAKIKALNGNKTRNASSK